MPPKGEKRAAEPKATEAKKAKTEEAEEKPVPAEEEAKEPKEFEEPDAPEDKREALKEPVKFDVADTTLNVVPTTGGKVLMSLADGGLQYLVAGARANVGVKKGRYMFEVVVVQALTPSDGTMKGRATMPGQMVRIGFSVAGSSLILGEEKDGICFDSDGIMMADGVKKAVCTEKFGREQAVAIVLNLDPKSPNKNTVAMYKDGHRICAPQALPESLVGKTIYPHVAFRNVSLQVHFGPTPLKALPFNCRMLNTAAVADIQAPKKATGKCEVLWPVAFPDEGTFDWVDDFLEKNPQYVELSERKIIDWAMKSGLWKGQRGFSVKHSNDKPDFNFGIPCMDDMSAKKLINTVAPIMPRNYLIMEVKSNLIKEEREASLKKFSSTHFKKTCMVVMGEPDEAWKESVHAKMLKEKTDAAEVEFKRKKLEKERKREMDKKKKEIEDKRKEMEAERLKAAKKAAMESVKTEGEGEEKMEVDGGSEEAKPDEEMKEEKKEEEEPKEEAKEEPAEEEEDKDEEMEPVELSEEEKKMNFKKSPIPDISEAVLTQSFGKFTVPEKSEGFDDIKYAWSKEAGAKEYLKKWVLSKKVTSKVEDLVPGEAFKTKCDEWKKTFEEWQKKQQEFKATGSTQPQEGEEKKDVDIYAVESITDIGNGEPLFSKFEFEDWVLLSLRVELMLLVQAFKTDVNDEERVGIHEKNIEYYYSKYFRKNLMAQMYGKASVAELLQLIKETVLIDEAGVLKLVDSIADMENYDMFVKFAEEQRRERQRRIDAGDEGGRLKFVQLSAMCRGVATTGISTIPVAPTPGGFTAPGAGWGYGGGKDGKKGDKGGFSYGFGYKGGKGGKGWK
eukprot:CAMPEP_0178388830 /NCGR_PEP_ID=MMETSP0689_2-20121128/9797_1 /TAXON_ID=160604 /ORGANISM="Amphidinium massartii, Strain CS-259" /LENGTH=843 /DNA_ID=CAMNT_0020009249 /DNA_START=13 /DNA_END=2544 /DNA_ORIENTATION=-